ncbi:hypothetical protein OAL36_03950 [Akkermansiaceae bacterium]|nr:hypothetical protein [Akkermansiaceae bacterium]MDC0307092.1 hypothetical protein [Akkermansiaceae bacterium]
MSKNFTKYKYQGNNLGKGKLVQAIVADYCKDNPSLSKEELSELFPDSLQGSIGVFSSIEEAEGKFKGKRHYVKSPIRLSNATVAVCNQWGIGNIASFIDHVQGMGFEVQEINEPADVDVVSLLTDDQHQELLGEIQDKINERGLFSVYVKNAGGQLRYVFLDIERDPNDSDCWYFVAKLEVAGASALVADDEESILDYIEGISDDLDDQYPAVGLDPEDMSDLLVRVIPAE